MSRHARYRQDLKCRAFDLIGGACVFCGTTEKIEAAHVKPTSLCGSNSRGMDRRYRDIIKNPDCYRPMCGKHHRVFDQLVRVRCTVIDEPMPF
jgi:hypothetical protein